MEIFHELSKKKELSFQKFLLGYEGGLDADSLQNVGIDCVDIRYKLLKRGTKVYTQRPWSATENNINVYSLNMDTLQTLLTQNSNKGENSSEGIACVRIYELTDDIYTLQISENTAREVCMLWTKSKDKDSVQEGVDETDYQKLLDCRSPNSKNFMDYCFTYNPFPGHVSAVVYTRQSSTYELLVTATCKADIPFLRRIQDLVLPRSAIDGLTLDADGYLRPSASNAEPTHAALDSVDGYAKVNRNDVFEEPVNGADPVQSFHDRFPSAEEYNDFKDDDHSLDYESITIRPLPESSPTHVTSPRPDQPPPPPPVAEPVYSTIDKSAKTPKPRSKSVDQPETPVTPTGAKPPRPPPLDTMPNSDGESPAQVSAKPSRPSAPPKIQRGKALSMDAGMGSSGNVSLDGKDDSLTPPPRNSQKVKGRQKPESTTRF